MKDQKCLLIAILGTEVKAAFMTQKNFSFLLALVLQLCWVECSRAAGLSGFTAALDLRLDKDSFREDEAISGMIRFKLVAPASWPLAEKPTVLLNGPQLVLDSDEKLFAVPTEIHFDGRIANPTMIGHSYEIPFKISAANEFMTNFPISARSFRVFSRGQHQLTARIQSPEWTEIWSAPPGGVYPELAGTFTSRPQIVSIDKSASLEIQHQQLVEVLEHTEDSKKEEFARFFYAQGRITRTDLLQLLTKSTGQAKGRLVELYKRYGGALRDLTLFERPQTKVVLDEHTNAPFFLKLISGENVRFVYSGAAMHNVNGIGHNYVANADNGAHSLIAPAEPGIYRVVCDIHSTPWGWVLVVSNSETK